MLLTVAVAVYITGAGIVLALATSASRRSPHREMDASAIVVVAALWPLVALVVAAAVLAAWSGRRGA